MRIKFKAGDPRAGTIAQMDSHRGQELIDSGAAVLVKEDGSDAEAAADTATGADAGSDAGASDSTGAAAGTGTDATAAPAARKTAAKTANKAKAK